MHINDVTYSTFHSGTGVFVFYQEINLVADGMRANVLGKVF